MVINAVSAPQDVADCPFNIKFKRVWLQIIDSLPARVFGSYRLESSQCLKGHEQGAVLSELEKMEIVIVSESTRLLIPLTKTQKLLLEPVGLSEDDLKAYITSS